MRAIVTALALLAAPLMCPGLAAGQGIEGLVGRFVADTVSHNDNVFFPFAGHDPAENCTFLNLQHAPGTDWGRWALVIWAFEKGTDVLALSFKSGFYLADADSVNLEGSWASSSNTRRVSIMGDTITMTGSYRSQEYYSRWIRIGEPSSKDFELVMTQPIILRFGCSR